MDRRHIEANSPRWLLSITVPSQAHVVQVPTASPSRYWPWLEGVPA
jgi:hypothetical protein